MKKHSGLYLEERKILDILVLVIKIKDLQSLKIFGAGPVGHSGRYSSYIIILWGNCDYQTCVCLFTDRLSFRDNYGPIPKKRDLFVKGATCKNNSQGNETENSTL